MRRPAMTGNQFRHPAIDEWIAEVDALLAKQREHSISPSEGGQLPDVGEVQQWTTSFADFTASVEQLLDRLTNDPGRWILVIEIDEAHDRFLRFVFYEDGSLVLETLGNRYLHGDYQLTQEQSADLAGLGWEEPVGSGRATWALIEATHFPEISYVAETVVKTLSQVFTCEPPDLLVLKLSSLSERGGTAASEQPPAQPHPEGDQDGNRHSPQPQLNLPAWPLPTSAPRPEPWGAYYRVLYPEPTRPTSAFGRWKRATTGVNITKAYWSARERARERWTTGPHTTGEWELRHPPVVLWIPQCAEAGCLACTWLGGGGTIERASGLARQHSVSEGDDPSVIDRLHAPFSARNGPYDQPPIRKSVPPRLISIQDRLSSGPLWNHYDERGLGSVVSSAVVDLDPPASNPEGPATLLYLDVEVEHDGDGYVWRCGVGEEEAGFGEGEWGRGGAVSVEQAELDCWETVVDLLRDETYTAEEIVEAVAQDGGGS
jgi:hypothetical protein